jgi:hypothetical protein
MNPRIAFLSLALAAGCGGNAPLATTISGTSPLPAPDAFTCLREQLKTTGFTQTMHDVAEMRLSARKLDENARRPDVQFRRVVDRIEFQVKPGTGDAITEIIGDAKTFAEYSTHRGPTEEQEKTSETAQKAVKTLIDKCSAAVDSLTRQG